MTPRPRNRRADRLSAVGEDPDARFSLANERTFLAWIRTSIALLVAGLAVAQFFESWSEAARMAIALPLMLIGAVISLRSYNGWEVKERAMRLGEPLPQSSLPRVLGFAVGAIAILAAVLTLVNP